MRDIHLAVDALHLGADGLRRERTPRRSAAPSNRHGPAAVPGALPRRSGRTSAFSASIAGAELRSGSSIRIIAPPEPLMPGMLRSGSGATSSFSGGTVAPRDPQRATGTDWIEAFAARGARDQPVQAVLIVGSMTAIASEPSSAMPSPRIQHLLGDPVGDPHLARGAADDHADREGIQASPCMGEVELQPAQMMCQLQRAPEMRQQDDRPRRLPRRRNACPAASRRMPEQAESGRRSSG